MTIELLRDPNSKRRWPTPESLVFFRHLEPRLPYCPAEDKRLVELASAHGWVVVERVATEDEQIDFCHRTVAAEYYEGRMLWNPVGV